MGKANISKSPFYKIKNGQNVTTDALIRICNILNCDVQILWSVQNLKQRRFKDEVDEFVFRNGWTQFRVLKGWL